MSITIERNGWGSQVSTSTHNHITINNNNPHHHLSNRSSRSKQTWKLNVYVSPNVPSTVYSFARPYVFSQSEQIPSTLRNIQVVISINTSAADSPIVIISRISTSLLPASQTIVPLDEDDTDPRDPRTIVALRQGHHLLTTFHPELTKDNRFHEYFVTECVLPTLSP